MEIPWANSNYGNKIDSNSSRRNVFFAGISFELDELEHKSMNNTNSIKVLTGRLCRCFGVLGLLFLIGCSGGEPVPEAYSNLVPVSGTVLLDGKPLQGASITFSPIGDDAVRRAYGLTDESGRYELMTPVRGRSVDETKGAIPGRYAVFINKLQMPDGTELPPDLTHADAMEQGAQESLSARYSNPEKTQLTAEIPSVGEKPVEFNFELKSKYR